jgi:hypothetical protein
LAKSTYPRCVYYRRDTNTWRVRPTGGAVRGMSFGSYPREQDACSVGAKVDGLSYRSEAFRLRNSLGIRGRGALAQAQRNQLCKDRYRARKRGEKVTA